jgi:hypothetical protein
MKATNTAEELDWILERASRTVRELNMTATEKDSMIVFLLHNITSQLPRKALKMPQWMSFSLLPLLASYFYGNGNRNYGGPS